MIVSGKTKIIGAVAAILTIIGTSFSLYSFTRSGLATADEVNQVRQIAQLNTKKSENNSYRLQAHTLEEQVYYAQKQVWNLENRLEEHPSDQSARQRLQEAEMLLEKMRRKQEYVQQKVLDTD